MASYSGGKFKQDMPPPGGYADIEYKRIPAQRIIGYKSAFFASTILTVYGYYYYAKRRVYLNRLKTDFRDHMIALEPLALAEQDRSFLRQLRHNRNVERDLMKNVPDWKVGTLWGKSVYENQPFNTIPNVALCEYYGHRDTWNTRHVNRPNWDVGLEDNDD